MEGRIKTDKGRKSYADPCRTRLTISEDGPNCEQCKSDQIGVQELAGVDFGAKAEARPSREVQEQLFCNMRRQGHRQKNNRERG